MGVAPHLQDLQALGTHGVPLVINSYFSGDRGHIFATNTSWYLMLAKVFI